MPEYQKFTTTGRLGITDLESEYPYYNAHDWPVWNPAFEDVTKDSYESDIPGYEQRVREWNEEYIAKLKASGPSKKKNDLFDMSIIVYTFVLLTGKAILSNSL